MPESPKRQLNPAHGTFEQVLHTRLSSVIRAWFCSSVVVEGHIPTVLMPELAGIRRAMLQVLLPICLSSVLRPAHETQSPALGLIYTGNLIKPPLDDEVKSQRAKNSVTPTMIVGSDGRLFLASSPITLQGLFTWESTAT